MTSTLLALELNKRDITYSGHPQLTVDVLGEDEPMLSEIKCDVEVVKAKGQIPFQGWANPEAKEWAQTDTKIGDHIVSRALQKARQAVNDFNKLCGDGYEQLVLTGGTEKIPDESASASSTTKLSGVLLNCRVKGSTMGHFMCAAGIDDGDIYHCPNSIKTQSV